MKERSTYRYNRDRRSNIWTALHILLIGAIGVIIFLLCDDLFLSLWLYSYVVVLVIFTSLSIPRRVEIDSEKISIHCTLDLTEIPIENIVSISKTSPSRLRRLIPLMGSYGFFGFFGHFFDLLHFRRVMIYATEWRLLIEIVDIYEDYYYISSRERDRFIAEVNSRRKAINAPSPSPSASA